MLLRSGRYDAVVVDGSVGARQAYVDLVVAALLRLRRHPPVIIVSDAQWKRGTSRLDRLSGSIGVRLLDGPSVTFCVLSAEGAEAFCRTWHVNRERVTWTRWPYLMTYAELAAPVSTGGGVFAGGDSLRDYGPLIEAARGIDAPVTIATRRPDVLQAHDVPANVTASAASPDRYVELLRSAAVVVVPLAATTERSAGETTIVNAMALGKLVVVPDRMGVRDYIEDGRNGLIVRPGDADDLRRALRWALDPQNADAAAAIALHARDEARSRMDPDSYVIELLRIADAALERRNERGERRLPGTNTLRLRLRSRAERSPSTAK